MDRRTSELIDHRKQNSQLGPGLTHLAEFKNILDGSRRSASCAGDSKIGPLVFGSCFRNRSTPCKSSCVEEIGIQRRTLASYTILKVLNSCRCTQQAVIHTNLSHGERAITATMHDAVWDCWCNVGCAPSRKSQRSLHAVDEVLVKKIRFVNDVEDALSECLVGCPSLTSAKLTSVNLFSIGWPLVTSWTVHRRGARTRCFVSLSKYCTDCFLN